MNEEIKKLSIVDGKLFWEAEGVVNVVDYIGIEPSYNQYSFYTIVEKEGITCDAEDIKKYSQIFVGTLGEVNRGILQTYINDDFLKKPFDDGLNCEETKEKFHDDDDGLNCEETKEKFHDEVLDND
jgi:hypothetical protein